MAILVNGERIENDVIQREAERMRPEFERAFPDEPVPQREARLQEWARENAIEQTLLGQTAKADPRPVPAEEVSALFDQVKRQRGEAAGPDGTAGADAAAGADGAAGTEAAAGADAVLRAEVEQHLRVRRVMEEACRDLPQPSDDEVRRYYEEHLQEFAVPERIRAAHIVKHVTRQFPPELAEAALVAVQRELEAGADFAALARQHSDCPENDGDLGWFPKGQMVEEFEHTVFRLKPGQVSRVFATRFGFHIVKVHEHKAAGPCGLREAAAEIRERLSAQARDKAMEGFLDGLRAKATVEEVP